MSLTCDCESEADCITLHITDRFDFEAHRGFHAACLARPRVHDYVIDLEGVTCMDSSALGMLLLLRDHAGEGAQIRIVNAGKSLRDTFRIAGLDGILAYG